ncbi:hypothetical protein DS909_18985 [Phaeobacter gallaeciensis]|uniref:DUF1214 domain-containing protein n=2 Tax=Roseobacteraceae TaxID=2854170 RepID=A0A366WR97_9RHOB|nr:DUF1214 domain-containing protein [Falsiruegeria litorea]MBT8171218.1 DUF1214 domain-containing protein [Falsiruegeria litorea]RBW51667.1 hypothetical protein DS909_18985 [Phaeobacter gallaeciensis]
MVKFRNDGGNRMIGSNNYVLTITKDPSAQLFWSIVVYDTDTRTILDNCKVTKGGKTTVGSRTDVYASMKMETSGPDAPPDGWSQLCAQPAGVRLVPVLAQFWSRADVLQRRVQAVDGCRGR